MAVAVAVNAMTTPTSLMTRFALSALIDDFPLAARRFDPPEGIPLRAAVVISCATGVDAKLYADFASYVELSSLKFSRRGLHTTLC